MQLQNNTNQTYEVTYLGENDGNWGIINTQTNCVCSFDGIPWVFRSEEAAQKIAKEMNEKESTPKQGGFSFITAKEAGLDWDVSNATTDYGYVPGFLRGYNFEFRHKETGKLDYSSCRFFYESVIRELENSDMAKFEGTPFYLESLNGYEPTGRAIFRGYYTEYWYEEERDWCVEEASDEVEALINASYGEQLENFSWDSSVENNFAPILEHAEF